MIDLEEIKNQLLSGKGVEKVFEKFDWKNFEETIAEIFRNNEFRVKRNFRFKTKSRYEIDLIAVKNSLVVCADCKEWASGRLKTSALRNAAQKQENRIKEFKKFLKKNLIAQKILSVQNPPTFLPLLITLLEENLVKENDTLVVPFEKLNAFLLEIEKYT